MSKKSIRWAATIYGALALIAGGGSALCADWGYEEVSGETPASAPAKKPDELRAAPAKSLAMPSRTTATPVSPAKLPGITPKIQTSAPRTTVMPGAAPRTPSTTVKKPLKIPTSMETPLPPPMTVDGQRSIYANPERERRQGILIAWLEMYEAATPGQLSDHQIVRIKEFYGALLEKKDPRALTIMGFWPALRKYLEKNPDQQENYSQLIYSLLRARTRTGGTTAGDGAAETELIGELLGPTRIAVAGTPPLTEDAVDAYADMACFLYEQKNPGKTIDAMENRALFSNVIMQKFKDAPSDTDRQAMTNFPIGWAKFKVLWAGADETQRKALLARLTASGVSNTAQTPADPMLAQVLKTWPL